MKSVVLSSELKEYSTRRSAARSFVLDKNNAFAYNTARRHDFVLDASESETYSIETNHTLVLGVVSSDEELTLTCTMQDSSVVTIRTNKISVLTDDDIVSVTLTNSSEKEIAVQLALYQVETSS